MLLFNCQEDDKFEKVSADIPDSVTSELVSIEQVMLQFKNFQIKEYLTQIKNKKNGNLMNRTSEEELLYFTKIKNNDYTTYLLLINDYSEENPYFLKLIITQDETSENIGYVKYIPEHQIPFVDETNFTGKIQLLDIEQRLRSENYFIDGREQPDDISPAARGVDGCTSSTTIITHNCTHGGNHAPGETCGEGYTNDAYYEIRITIVCEENPAYVSTPLPTRFMDISGGSGGGSAVAPYPHQFALTQFTNGLNFRQLEWWKKTENRNQKNQILTYLEENYFSEVSKFYAEEMIDAAKNNILISLSPFFKYPLGSNYKVLYPELTYLVQEYVPTLKDDAVIINAITSLTDLSNEEVKRNLTWGDGAEINISQLGTNSNGHQYKGKFNPNEPDKIFIDIDLVNQLEDMPEGESRGMLRRLIVYSVLLHELVHYADYDADGIMALEELGDIFEEIVGNGWVLEFALDDNGQETNEIVFIKVN